MKTDQHRASELYTAGYADRVFSSPVEELAFVRKVIKAYCHERGEDSNHDISVFADLIPLLAISVSPAELKKESEKHKARMGAGEC